MKKRTAFIIAIIIVATLFVLLAILLGIIRQNKTVTISDCPICNVPKTNETPAVVEPKITVDIPETITYTFPCGNDECSNEEQIGEGDMIEVEVETEEGTAIEMQPKETPTDVPTSTSYDLPIYKGITTLKDCSPLGGRFLTPDGEDADGICVVE